MRWGTSRTGRLNKSLRKLAMDDYSNWENWAVLFEFVGVGFWICLGMPGIPDDWL